MTAKRLPAALTRPGALVITLVVPYALLVLFRPEPYPGFFGRLYPTVQAGLVLLSIVIGLSSFAVVWQTVPYHRRGWLFLLALGLLASSLLDFLHTLHYREIPGFQVTALADAYWMLARLVAAVGFLAGAACPVRWEVGSRAKVLLALPLLVVLAFAEGAGLGLAGAGSTARYAAIAILIVGASLFWWRYWREGENVAYTLAAALCISAFSELAFTPYLSAFQGSHLLGRLYMLLANFMVLRAVFLYAVQQPYQDLVEARNLLEQAYQRLESLVERRTQQLQESNRRLEEAASRDSLTGVYNRGYLAEHFEELLGVAKQREEPLAVIIMDIDHFKEINDHWGHQLGDRCLCLLVELLRPHLRRDDVLGRYGGDEFVVLLPATNIENALEVAERLRSVVEEGTVAPGFTLSLGVAVYPRDGNSPERLLQWADQALYRAKNMGRNRVVVAWEAAG